MWTNFGFLLKDCSIENIKECDHVWSPVSLLKSSEERARRAWEFARANHTREKFADEYRKIVTKIITSTVQNLHPGALSAREFALAPTE